MVRYDTVLPRRFWELLASRGLGGRVAMAEYLRWAEGTPVCMMVVVMVSIASLMVLVSTVSRPAPRPGWTFHAKGLWYSPPGEDPTLTVVGSPNYGYRWGCTNTTANTSTTRAAIGEFEIAPF